MRWITFKDKAQRVVGSSEGGDLSSSAETLKLPLKYALNKGRDIYEKMAIKMAREKYI